jgi:hypothetical protein
VIRPVLPVAHGPRNRAREAGAAEATAGARADRVAPVIVVALAASVVPVAPAVAVALAASAGPAAGVAPAVRGNPMTHGARLSPVWLAAVAVARTTPAAVGVAAAARSAA